MNIVVIPARGGSKGIPRKNMIEICGRPLIYYSIQVAMDSMLVDKVVVTSDDDEILEYASNMGASVIHRAALLASDSAPTEPCIRNVIDRFVLDGSDNVILLQPTSPLRTIDILNRCIEGITMYQHNSKTFTGFRPCGYDAVFSAHSEKYYHWNNDKGWQIDGHNFMAPRLPKQQAGSNVRENGSIYITSAKNWICYNRYGLDPYPFMIPPICGMELDYKWQVPIFENIIENGLHEEVSENWNYS